jgi:hypothetical protein
VTTGALEPAGITLPAVGAPPLRLFVLEGPVFLVGRLTLINCPPSTDGVVTGFVVGTSFTAAAASQGELLFDTSCQGRASNAVAGGGGGHGTRGEDGSVGRGGGPVAGDFTLVPLLGGHADDRGDGGEGGDGGPAFFVHARSITVQDATAIDVRGRPGLEQDRGGASIQLLQLSANPLTTIFFVPPVVELVARDNFAIALSDTGGVHYGSFTGAPEGGGPVVDDDQLAVVFAGPSDNAILSGDVVVTRSGDGRLFELTRLDRAAVARPDPASTGDTAVLGIAADGATLAVRHTNRVALYTRTATPGGWALLASATAPRQSAGNTLAFHERHVVLGLPGDSRCGAGAGSARLSALSPR